MELRDRKDATAPGTLLQAFGGALAGLARRTGCSATGCPLPEVREAARDLFDRPPAQAPSEPLDRVPA